MLEAEDGAFIPLMTQRIDDLIMMINNALEDSDQTESTELKEMEMEESPSALQDELKDFVPVTLGMDKRASLVTPKYGHRRSSSSSSFSTPRTTQLIAPLDAFAIIHTGASS